MTEIQTTKKKRTSKMKTSDKRRRVHRGSSATKSMQADAVLAKPKEGRAANRGPLKHDGKSWRVLSPVTYESNATGDRTDAGVYLLDEYGDALRVEDGPDEGERIANVITDIDYNVAEDLWQRGVLEPVLA